MSATIELRARLVFGDKPQIHLPALRPDMPPTFLVDHSRFGTDLIVFGFDGEACSIDRTFAGSQIETEETRRIVTRRLIRMATIPPGRRYVCQMVVALAGELLPAHLDVDCIEVDR